MKCQNSQSYRTSQKTCLSNVKHSINSLVMKPHPFLPTVCFRQITACYTYQSAFSFLYFALTFQNGDPKTVYMWLELKTYITPTSVPWFTVQCIYKVPLGFWKIVARKQIELATCSLRQIIVKLWNFLLISVDVDVGSLGSTENVQTIFELLTCSAEHGHCNSRDRIPVTGLQVIKSVNWFSEHITRDMDAPSFQETPLPTSYYFVTRRLLIELCAVISLSLGDWFCLKKNHPTQRALSCTVPI
jgi:hypothetical protein